VRDAAEGLAANILSAPITLGDAQSVFPHASTTLATRLSHGHDSSFFVRRPAALAQFVPSCAWHLGRLRSLVARTSGNDQTALARMPRSDRSRHSAAHANGFDFRIRSRILNTARRDTSLTRSVQIAAVVVVGRPRRQYGCRRAARRRDHGRRPLAARHRVRQTAQLLSAVRSNHGGHVGVS
jgi:hypothetical protein